MSNEKLFLVCLAVIVIVFIICVCIDDIFEKYFNYRVRIRDMELENRDDQES